MTGMFEYHDAVKAIKTAILQSQYQAARGSNEVQLKLYLAIGAYLSANTRAGAWGMGAIAAISERLRKEMPGLRGFSASNLKNMRAYYEEWQSVLKLVLPAEPGAESLLEDVNAIRQKLLANCDSGLPDGFFSIGFSYHLAIMSGSKNIEERRFYIQEAARNHYSLDALKRAIRANEYHHRGAQPNNFTRTLSPSQQALRAVLAFKDEYLLDFINVEELGVRDVIDVDERVLEQGIVQNIKNFIMEFGRDFAFVGNQYHLDAFGEDQYIDLLFFNRELNCLVAVELKTGPFKTSYLGQLSGYLSVLDEFVRKPHESYSIGIILCKDMNKAFVDFVVRSYDHPMGVATYKTSKDMPEELLRALPPIEELESLLEGGFDGE